MQPSKLTEAESKQFNEAYERLQRLVSALASEYPQAGLSFGYIGNLERWGDDRSWRVFTTLPPPTSDTFYRNSPSWPYGGWESTPKNMVDGANRAEKELESWVRKQLKLPALT